MKTDRSPEQIISQKVSGVHEHMPVFPAILQLLPGRQVPAPSSFGCAKWDLESILCQYFGFTA